MLLPLPHTGSRNWISSIFFSHEGEEPHKNTGVQMHLGNAKLDRLNMSVHCRNSQSLDETHVRLHEREIAPECSCTPKLRIFKNVCRTSSESQVPSGAPWRVLTPWISEDTGFWEVIKADCSASTLAAVLLREAASPPPLSISHSDKWSWCSVPTPSNLFYQKHRRFECGESGFSIFLYVKSSGGRKPLPHIVRRICIAERA